MAERTETYVYIHTSKCHQCRSLRKRHMLVQITSCVKFEKLGAKTWLIRCVGRTRTPHRRQCLNSNSIHLSLSLSSAQKRINFLFLRFYIYYTRTHRVCMHVNTYFTQNAALKQKKREKKMNEYMTMKKIGVICKA